MAELGIYYVIRHKASGEIMPQCIKRGYSHWNPSTGQIPNTSLGVPRLIPSRRTANNVINRWVTFPNGERSSYQSYDGEWDDSVDFKEDGRKKEDLEVVEVIINERNLETST